MAYILRRKGKKGYSYRVQVARVGFKKILKTFDNKTDAKKWSWGIERELDQGRYISVLIQTHLLKN